MKRTRNIGVDDEVARLDILQIHPHLRVPEEPESCKPQLRQVEGRSSQAEPFAAVRL